MKFQNEIDNSVFRFNYKFMLRILLGFAIYNTAHQHISKPIDCIPDPDPTIDKDTMNLYCWTESTYTIREIPKGSRVVDFSYPGMEGLFSGALPEAVQVTKYHVYYRLIGSLLFFQALCFYIPRHCWLKLEGGLMDKLLPVDLRHAGIVLEDKKEECKKAILDYFLLNFNRRNDIYASKFVLCEVLSFVNVVGQFFLMDLYLGNEFASYGLELLSMTTDNGDGIHPFDKLFPTTAMCTFNKPGFHDNSTVTYNAVCILPLNMFNRLFYGFLWGMFIFAGFFSGLWLLFRLLFISLLGIRKYLLRSVARSLVESGQVDLFSQKATYGDWFLLLLLGSNMDRLIFLELIADLEVRLAQKIAV